MDPLARAIATGKASASATANRSLAKNESRHRLKEHIPHRLLKAVDNTDDFIELFPQKLKEDRFCNFLYAQGKEDIEQAIQHGKKQWKKVQHDLRVYSKPLSPHDMDYRPFKKYWITSKTETNVRSIRWFRDTTKLTFESWWIICGKKVGRHGKTRRTKSGSIKLWIYPLSANWKTQLLLVNCSKPSEPYHRSNQEILP